MTTLEHLIEALSLAQKAERKNIKGNPFVGAIVVDENNNIIRLAEDNYIDNLIEYQQSTLSLFINSLSLKTVFNSFK